MLAESKFTQYLIYALGEIVLVVVGILIALSLNNWNADRKTGIQEHALLKEMQSNLQKDLQDCRGNIAMQQRYLNSNKTVLNQLNSRAPFHDSLRVHYASIWGATTLTTNTSAYDNLKSLGVNLISNDSLRRVITQLYSDRYIYLVGLETGFDQGISMSQVLPQIVSKVVIDTLMQSGYPLDLSALTDDDTFKGVLRINIATREFMISVYQSIDYDIVRLNVLIDEELTKMP